MKKLVILWFILSWALSLTSCATIVSGQEQPISVNTPAVKGASCELANNKGKWNIASTPGQIKVHRSYEDMRIVCQKKGYKNAEKKVSSSTKALAFGNILFGGGLGAGIDIANGSAYDYPAEINLPMEKKLG